MSKITVVICSCFWSIILWNLKLHKGLTRHRYTVDVQNSKVNFMQLSLEILLLKDDENVIKELFSFLIFKTDHRYQKQGWRKDNKVCWQLQHRNSVIAGSFFTQNIFLQQNFYVFIHFWAFKEKNFYYDIGTLARRREENIDAT